MYSQGKLKQNKYIKFLERFISEESCDEEEHGVLENHNISLREWCEALSIFEDKNIYLSLGADRRLRTRFSDKPSTKNILNMLLGGGISGLCHKSYLSDQQLQFQDYFDFLGCPDCMIESSAGEKDRPALFKNSNSLECSKCGCKFPIAEGIIFLLPSSELRELYPEISNILY